MLINGIFGGKPYESICARAWRIYSEELYIDHILIVHIWAEFTVKFCDKIEKNHCENAHRTATIIRSKLRID